MSNQSYLPEIDIRHLTKSFDERKVLDDVSLTIEKGDIYGVLGLSGAGKSTLVRCINGLETFDSGEIYFRDQLLCSPEVKVSRENKRRITMIFQSFNLLEQRNVLRNVELSLELNKKEVVPETMDEEGHSIKEIIRMRALSALEKVGLQDHINQFPSQLSGGQKQRVAIARALIMKPDVLLSDEATSALDPDTTNAILELLQKLNKDLGLTIIMISHQMNAIEKICNKVAIIDKAKIVEQGDLSDVFLNPKAEISKKLIYSGHVNTTFDENKTLRFLFDGNTDEPIIANIVQDCNILVSVVYADTKLIDGKVYGQVVVKMPSKAKDVIKLKKYLELHNINYEDVTSQEVKK